MTVATKDRREACPSPATTTESELTVTTPLWASYKDRKSVV